MSGSVLVLQALKPAVQTAARIPRVAVCAQHQQRGSLHSQRGNIFGNSTPPITITRP